MKKRLSILLAVFALVLCCGTVRADEAITRIDQLNDPDRTVGVNTGSISELTVQAELPLAKIAYYNDKFMGYLDVANGRIDAFVYDVRQMSLSIRDGLKGVRLLDETMKETTEIAVGISDASEIPDLQAMINHFIAQLRADGTLDDMYTRWLLNGEDTMPAIDKPSFPRGRLVVGTTGNVPPYSYYNGTTLAGYDIELATRLAAWLGMELEFSVMDYDAVSSAIKSGKVDCFMSNLQVSPGRAESIQFSDILYEEKQGVMVRATEAQAAYTLPTFWEEVSSSFQKTFIRESRWTLFLEGVGTTMLITALTILVGTALGFLVFLMCRNGNAAANAATRLSLWLVQGMPMVVLLMILYYVVLGSVAIGGIAVAVIGFSLTFGASVFGLLKMGVGTIDRGQYEAAYALGHSNRRTFFRIILPQVIPHILPAYQSEIVGLIKATAIVGYIAVQDLTKMSDIVRSRTYDAFFPLIAITIIYFALEGLLILLVSKVRVRLDPKKRSQERILKGVNIHD